MKKHLFFAFAAAAALASCSSHDDFDNYSAGTPQAPVDDNSPQEILLGVGAQANVATRGTGTVGGDHNDITTNKWQNQRINVYMFKKYEVKQVKGDDGPVSVPTKAFELAKEKENGPAIYDNALFMAPKGVDAGAARHMDNGEGYDYAGNGYKRSYYPMNGNFDFWAYRLDDAGTATKTTYMTYDDPAAAAAADYTPCTDESGNQWYADAILSETTTEPEKTTESAGKKALYNKTTVTGEPSPVVTPGEMASANIKVPFVIDGTQDVMAAQTALTRQDTLTLVDPLKLDDVKGNVDANGNGSISDELDANQNAQDRFDGYAKSLYSAKTARKGVQPNLVFSHLLTRFTFDAKAYKKEFAKDNADEIRIKKIVVYSKTSGNIVAQYKAVNKTDAGHPENSLPGDYKVSEGQDYAIKSTLEVDTKEEAKPLSLMARIDPTPDPKDENSELVELTDPKAPGKSRDAYYWLTTVDGENAHKAGERYNKEGVPTTGELSTDYIKITESGIALPYGENTEAGKLYTEIGEAMLVMPGEEKYVMDITLEQSVYGREDAEGTGVPSTIKAIESTIKGLEIRAEDVVKDETKGVAKFQAGNSYNVRVVVYGMSKIEVKTTLEPWVEGGHIDLDPDKQF